METDWMCAITGPKWQRIRLGWPVIPLSRLFAAIERVPLVHLLREIRIGVAAQRIGLHGFRRANFRQIVRRKRGTGDFDALHGSDLLLRGASGNQR